MTKTIKVYSSDSNNSLAQLKITAFGEEPGLHCSWTPETADFGEVLVNKKARMKLELTNNDTSEVKLEVVSEPTTEYVKKYKIKKDDLKPQKSTEVEVELQQDIPMGPFKTALTLQAEGNPNARFTIPITGTVVEKLTPKDKVEKGQASNKPVARPKTPARKTIKTEPETKQSSSKEDKGSGSGSK